MRPLFDRIYCVSLLRSNDRRQHAARELAAVGWGDFRFFDATDHDSPLVADYRRRGAVATFPPCFRCGKRVCDCANNVLIDPQVATFITFKRLWEDMINDEVGVALIVEDDVKFTEYAPELIRRALTPENLAACSLRPDAESLLRLAWALTPEHTRTGAYRFVPGLLKMANPAFAVTHGMARRLLAAFSSIDTTADIYIHERIGLAVTNHTLMPPIAYELSWSTGAFPSLIHPKPAQVEHLRRERPTDTAAIAAAEHEIAAHVMNILPRDVLCVGHPRCGSAYMAKLLSTLGLDVGHERLGAHGISSWMFAVDDDPYPFAANRGAETRRDKHFTAIIHHVRNPAEAVPSIMVENQYSAVSYQFRRKHIRQELGLDLEAVAAPLERAVVAYLSWNFLIERMRPHLVVQVENCEEPVRQLLVSRGWIAEEFRPSKIPPKNFNSQKPYQGKLIEKPRVRPQDWEELPSETLEKLRRFCQIYGYPEPPWRTAGT